MQSVCLDSTVRVGNHLLTAAEAAAGLPPRDPFMGWDGAPTDPDRVDLKLTAPTGEIHTFGYPDAGPTDSGTLTKEETGRYYVDWTPGMPPAGSADDDGLWRWKLKGFMTLGTSRSDKDVFYVEREDAPGG